MIWDKNANFVGSKRDLEAQSQQIYFCFFMADESKKVAILSLSRFRRFSSRYLPVLASLKVWKLTQTERKASLLTNIFIIDFS